jgi:hypothetical protein
MRGEPPPLTRARQTKPRPQGPTREQGKTADHEQQGTDRVFVADVADHLGGVDQVVDGDKVEARIELLEEEVFAHRHEQHQRGRRPQRQADRDAASRCECKQQGQRQQQVAGLDGVVDRADRQGSEQGAGQHTVRATEGRPQHQARQYADSEVKQQHGRQRRDSRFGAGEMQAGRAGGRAAADGDGHRRTALEKADIRPAVIRARPGPARGPSPKTSLAQ